jgi:predicted GIY-YIG superfamily endonuclease
MYYVYIIESLLSVKWYYGFTNAHDQRLDAHNKGLNISTANRGPWWYIFQRPFENESDARCFKLRTVEWSVVFINDWVICSHQNLAIVDLLSQLATDQMTTLI